MKRGSPSIPLMARSSIILLTIGFRDLDCLIDSSRLALRMFLDSFIDEVRNPVVITPYWDRSTVELLKFSTNLPSVTSIRRLRRDKGFLAKQRTSAVVPAQ